MIQAMLAPCLEMALHLHLHLLLLLPLLLVLLLLLPFRSSLSDCFFAFAFGAAEKQKLLL
jgi:hypothetical protein